MASETSAGSGGLQGCRMTEESAVGLFVYEAKVEVLIHEGQLLSRPRVRVGGVQWYLTLGRVP